MPKTKPNPALLSSLGIRGRGKVHNKGIKKARGPSRLTMITNVSGTCQNTSIWPKIIRHLNLIKIYMIKKKIML